MEETYRTIDGTGEVAFAVRGSEFVGYARPARSIDAAEAFVADVRAEYPDATHVVPAYRVRTGRESQTADSADSAESGGDGLLREYQSDDGEPGGSAGRPALTVLQRENLENLAVAVVRYYGGTNLGVGGLARAYGRAAKEAIAETGIVEERPHRELEIEVAYDDSGTVRGILESTGVEFDATYEERVSFSVRVQSTDAAALRERVLSATSARAEIETGSSNSC